MVRSFWVGMFFFIGFGQLINAQDLEKVLNVKKAKGEIVLDGDLKESDWANAEVAKDFRWILPWH